MRRTVLLTQHDPADATSVREALGGSGSAEYDLEWVRTCAAGWERLAMHDAGTSHADGGVAGVLLDLSLPDAQGLAAFECILAAASQIPILVLSTASAEAIARKAVQGGAQDYLLKSRVDNYVLPKALGSMLDRAANAEALFEAKERAQVTLDSIGDAVMSVDTGANVTYLNAVAEQLTGWPLSEAVGRPIERVFRIIGATTRESLEHPLTRAMTENQTVALAPHCLLVRRDGMEAAIEDSSAPIHDRHGNVIGAVMVFRDVSAARETSLRMAHLAQHDCLTDLPNRLLLKDRLTQAMGLAQRRRHKLAVLFLDVDRFKHTNDSLGHAIGDRLLQAVAQRLVACVRTSDTVSREGGDEFVILLSELGRSRDAASAAEKILTALREPYRIDDHEIHITASIGIVVYADDGTDAEMLMKHADVAMYHAKDAGRDTYRFFTADMNARAAARQSIESGLRHALERQEFVLYYQPKLDLNTGTITGAEALIRWLHPQRGLVAPAEFIPTAEECGIIAPIGRWILREACTQAHAWLQAGLQLPRIAVNISAAELRRKDFVAHVRGILAQTGLPPDRLELELTETFLMQDSRSTATVLHALKDVGVQLALDDFGTGYSSLSYAKRFPIDTLKIDRSFVRDLTMDPSDASIVSAVISMGRSLHMRVVAEGVETAAQLGFLRAQSCPEGQGYLLGRPVAGEECTRLLSSCGAGTAFA